MVRFGTESCFTHDVWIHCVSVMSKRINVILPETTILAIDRLVKKGERSHLIDKAVRHYVATRSLESLQERLKAASIRDRDLEVEVAGDWAATDEESWRQIDARERD